MAAKVLEAPIRNWACPSCNTKDRTQRPDAHTQMHNCAGLNGLSAPLVEVRDHDDRVDARHVLLEREDYAGSPWSSRYMSTRTDHGDGSNDCTVYPDTAAFVMGAYAPAAIDRAQYGGTLVVHPGTAGAGAAVGTGFYRKHAFHDPIVERMAEVARKLEARMAWSASGVFAFAVLLLAQKGGQTLNSDTYKCALYSSNTITPDKTVTTAALTEYNGTSSQWVTGGENSGSGYSAGGATLSGVTLSQSTNVVTFTASNPQWTSATITAYGDLVYDTTVSSEGLCFNYFGGVQSVTNGTFTVSWNASGIAAITC